MYLLHIDKPCAVKGEVESSLQLLVTTELAAGGPRLPRPITGFV